MHAGNLTLNPVGTPDPQPTGRRRRIVYRVQRRVPYDAPQGALPHHRGSSVRSSYNNQGFDEKSPQ